MQVTRIYTDASVQKPGDSINKLIVDKISAISVVVWHPELRFEEHFFRLAKFYGSGTAELQAIYYALEILSHRSDACFLYTDCLGAVEALQHMVPRPGTQDFRLVKKCQQLMDDKGVGVVHCPRNRSLFNSRANHLARCALKNQEPITVEQYIDSFTNGIKSARKKINDLGIVYSY